MDWLYVLILVSYLYGLIVPIPVQATTVLVKIWHIQETTCKNLTQQCQIGISKNTMNRLADLHSIHIVPQKSLGLLCFTGKRHTVKVYSFRVRWGMADIVVPLLKAENQFFNSSHVRVHGFWSDRLALYKHPSSKCSGCTVRCSWHCRPNSKQYSVACSPGTMPHWRYTKWPLYTHCTSSWGITSLLLGRYSFYNDFMQEWRPMFPVSFFFTVKLLQLPEGLIDHKHWNNRITSLGNDAYNIIKGEICRSQLPRKCPHFTLICSKLITRYVLYTRVMIWSPQSQFPVNF